MTCSDLIAPTDHDDLFIGKGVEPVAKSFVNGKSARIRSRCALSLSRTW